jgi:3-hydroxybutyryl-CoA dehydratase
MSAIQDLESLVGQVASFRKTVGESDVYLFAGLTGDLSPNHVDEQAMASTPFGTRIAHGVLIIGFMSTAATRFVETTGTVAVSAGYDRIRFIAPVRIGQTVSVTYTITAADPVRRRTTAHVEAHTDDGELCAVADHLLTFVDGPDA